jgi:3-oxoacyl-[acyl-carrier protein] reductase
MHLVTALIEDGHDMLPTSRRADVPGSSGHYTQCDVRDEDQVQRLYARMRNSRGALDALIVTAGTFGAIGRVPFTDTAAWEDAYRTNVLGLYHLAKHGIPLLEQGDRPRIITFAGGGAFGPFPRYSAYACSKAAVVRLTECLAAELQPKGIAVNAIAPGMVETPIHAQTLQAGAYRAGAAQFAKTLEVAERGVPMAVPVDCVRWLLSKDADGITGRTIAANFDPWRAPEFAAQLLADPDYCTLRRQGPRVDPLDMAPDDEAYS